MKKTLFFWIIVGVYLLYTFESYAAYKIEPDVRYIVRARPNAESSLMEISFVENNTGFPIEFKPDYSIGNDFYTEMWVNGRLYYYEKEYLSNEMNDRIRNARGTVSINDLCKTQAASMRRVFNEGDRFRQDYLKKLAEDTKKSECNCPDDYEKPYSQNEFWKPTPMIDNGYRPTTLTGNLQRDIQIVPVTPNYGITSCIDKYKQLYPNEYEMYMLNGYKLSAFNTIPNGAQRRAVKKCFSGKTQVGRNLGWILPVVGVGIGLAVDGLEGNGIDAFGIFDNDDHSGDGPITPEDDYHPGSTPKN